MEESVLDYEEEITIDDMIVTFRYLKSSSVFIISNYTIQNKIKKLEEIQKEEDELYKIYKKSLSKLNNDEFKKRLKEDLNGEIQKHKIEKEKHIQYIKELSQLLNINVFEVTKLDNELILEILLNKQRNLLIYSHASEKKYALGFLGILEEKIKKRNEDVTLYKNNGSINTTMGFLNKVKETNSNQKRFVGYMDELFNYNFLRENDVNVVIEIKKNK
ncbi:hypothetical protein [Virgibacillus sp. DJP39]|uniref:hypothetical protein n=1 Tax=Virgibacillus sp. DJP39 TaxID=3409790 RepID=UPI003BB623FF